MRVSLAYTLIRHRIHLHVGAMRVAAFHRHGVSEIEFEALYRDMKRSREAIARIHMIAQSPLPKEETNA